MSGSPRRFIFNRYQVPAPIAIPDFYADDPIVQLTEGQEFRRNDRQLACLHALGEPTLNVADPIFGAGLEWAYREYIVHALWPADADTDHPMPPGNETAQPVDADARRRQLEHLQPVERPDSLAALRLCLFNVIVALEWRPSRRYLRQLAWAFRRASDFLYDATDGRMAFGQVVFGGPRLLNCADVQIMASNRLLPRAWRSAMHEARKYMPVRAGRGLWNKRNHVSIGWDEPEGYRVLVHEWCHYALELHDEYLTIQDVFLPSTLGPASAAYPMLARGAYTLVIPQISLAIESIMAVLEGTSELVSQTAHTSAERQRRIWDEIKTNGRFTFLDPVAQRPQLDGPGRLPLPLPRIHYLDDLSADRAPWRAGGGAVPYRSPGLRLAVPPGIQADHCWVYVIQGMPERPERIIAQGTLDARSIGDGFPLLGAQAGDTVVLVSEDNGKLSIVRGRIAGVAPDGVFAQINVWEIATPPLHESAGARVPTVDVLPSAADPADLISQIRVQISGDEPYPEQVWVFPHGQQDPKDVIALGGVDSGDWTSAARDVPMLDGHVLMRWGDGRLLISSFSQGGGPQTHSPDGPPPISAGSSEGNVMLFFRDEDFVRDYSYIRIVTTLIHGMEHQLPSGARARSYAFSLASNAALPHDLKPTLVMYFDSDAVTPGGDLLIYRHTGGDRWEPIPTYLPPGSSFAAAPLNAETAPQLIALAPRGQRVERYRLYWTPRGA